MCPWVIMGPKSCMFMRMWRSMNQSTQRLRQKWRRESALCCMKLLFVFPFTWDMLKYVEVVDTAKFLTSILIRFGQLRSYCNRNNQKHICSIMLKLVFQIELFVTNNCPSEWHEGTRTSPSSWKRNLIWRWRSSQNNMLGKPVIPGCGLAVEFFPTQKNDEFFDYAENFVAGVQATQNRQRSRSGMPCLTWALIQPRQRKDVWVHVWRFWVSQIICVLYGEWYPLDEGNRWNTFSYAQIYRTVYSNLYGGHRHAWMHLYEWGWSAVNDPSFDGSWCVLNWKGSWLGFVVLGSSGVAFAPHAIRHAGLDWIGFW